MNIKILFIPFLASVWYVYVEAIGGGDYIPITEAPYYVMYMISNTADRLFTLAYAALGNLHTTDNLCGSVILSEYWILTAAHCIINIYDTIIVRTGRSTQEREGIHNIVVKIIVHPDYEMSASKKFRTFMHNDIALLKLAEPIQFNEYQQPIKISSKPLEDRDNVGVVGLGYVKDFTKTVSLKKTYMVITMSIEEFKLPTMIFMGEDHSQGCGGDSGGPVVRDGLLVGTISMGSGCRDWDRRFLLKVNFITPTYMYYDWIIKYTGRIY